MRFLCLVVKLNESHAIFAGSIILSGGGTKKNIAKKGVIKKVKFK